jgi:hypothetical protein
MTLRTDLSALLAEFGIDDVDLDAAVADDHLRSTSYQRVVAATADADSRDYDRTLVATILRDPVEMVSKTAVVDLIDRLATRATDTREFQQWSAEILPALTRLEAEATREFIRHRVQDWLFWLSIKDGHVPVAAELADVTNWMQRLLAEESSSLQVLTLLSESGGTKKIRNIAKNRILAYAP